VELLHAGAALLAGLLIGVERGWTLRQAADGTRVAGIRTFALVGLAGGLAGHLSSRGYGVVGALVVASLLAVLAAGYWRSAGTTARPNATSAIAATATLALGFLAGVGEPALSIAGAAVVTLILALRSQMHRWVSGLDEADVMAFARYAVIALAICRPGASARTTRGSREPCGSWSSW
jgi:uncharacterized membrane protein (DUF4010 family)